MLPLESEITIFIPHNRFMFLCHYWMHLLVVKIRAKQVTPWPISCLSMFCNQRGNEMNMSMLFLVQICKTI